MLQVKGILELFFNTIKNILFLLKMQKIMILHSFSFLHSIYGPRIKVLHGINLLL
nr:MAG TPA: hypothetical protein [Caudoviricetes sp.]